MHAMLSFNKLARGPTTRLHKLRLSACLRALLPFCRLRPFASCAARLKLIKTSTRSNAGCFSDKSNQIQVRSPVPISLPTTVQQDYEAPLRSIAPDRDKQQRARMDADTL